MENTQNQCHLVMAHLKANGFITDREAYDVYGIRRLAAVIWTLKHTGNNIVSEMKTGVNRFGKTVRFAEYRLAE